MQLFENFKHYYALHSINTNIPQNCKMMQIILRDNTELISGHIGQTHHWHVLVSCGRWHLADGVTLGY